MRSVLSWWSELSGHHFLEPKTNHCSIRCIGSGASAPLSVVPLGGWRSHYILKVPFGEAHWAAYGPGKAPGYVMGPHGL